MRTSSGVGIYSEYFAEITKRPPYLRLQNGTIPDVRNNQHTHMFLQVEKPQARTACDKTRKPTGFTYSIITKIYGPSSRKKNEKTD